MTSWTKRLTDVVTTGARQVLPLNGLLGGGWQPVTAIAVYWVESLVLVLVTALLCWIVERRMSDRVLAATRAAGDEAAVASVEAERQAASRGGVSARDVLMVHVFSMVVFGVFITAMLLILIDRRETAPFDAEEFRTAVSGMLLVLAVGSAIEMAFPSSRSVEAVGDRVESCLARWALLWMLCFFGTIVPMFVGSPAMFLTMFAVLKALWEGGGVVGRLFGRPSTVEAPRM